jgi:hypothetical protein
LTTFVLGAGASRHVGYPFAKSMGSGLFAWMERKGSSGCFDFRGAAISLRARFGGVDDIEQVLTKVDDIILGPQGATPELRRDKGQLANHDKPALVEAIREWFSEVREGPAESYRLFAQRVVQPGDCIISFNYDVSLDRELKLANLWEIGDGYGFPIEGLGTGSQVKILKLHGSANWIDAISFPTRPLIRDSELRFLGYPDQVDPWFPRNGVPGVLPLILPTACKRFYIETTFGRMREDFWDELWRDAALHLTECARVAICGYSLPSVDERACRLLFEGRFPARVEVCCGDDTERIVRRFQDCGHDARSAGQKLFNDWARSQAGCGG